MTLLHLTNGTRVRVNRHDDDTTSLQLYPLVGLTAVVDEMLSQGCADDICSITRTPHGIPWTSPCDKLCQAEFYYAKEATDASRRCCSCDGPVDEMLPLSRITEGRRSQDWFCLTCKDYHPHYQPAPTEDGEVESLCGMIPFGPEPFLGKDLHWEDFEYHLAHLPRHKSAGSDGVPYEILQGASLPVRQLLFECVSHNSCAGKGSRDIGRKG